MQVVRNVRIGFVDLIEQNHRVFTLDRTGIHRGMFWPPRRTQSAIRGEFRVECPPEGARLDIFGVEFQAIHPGIPESAEQIETPEQVRVLRLRGDHFFVITSPKA